jgi:hypothetical protein
LFADCFDILTIFGILTLAPEKQDVGITLFLSMLMRPFQKWKSRNGNTSFGDPRPAKWVKIPPEIKWETPMAAQVIAAVHGDIKE